ncbi:MAG: hypothetical protein SPL50_05485 [Alloprevotella sp.]|nr:hypothetical protein [Alloprevotella sp.]
MKKTYFAPSTVTVNLKTQSMLMLSLQDPTITVGQDDGTPGQLTREMGGWSSENWSDVEEGED